MNVCMYGASSNSISQVYFDKASEFGQNLAKFGHVLIYGGGNSGVMGAAAVAALENGGKVVGIAPYFFKEGDTARQMVFSVRLSSATTKKASSGSRPLSTHSTEA